MTKAPTIAEMSKGQSDNTNNATKMLDYTAWNNYSNPTGVVNRLTGPPPTPRNSRVKGHMCKTCK